MGREQLGWTLIGCGAVMWSVGESLWRVYVLVLHQSPFPSWADVGYSLLPPLVFLGLLTVGSAAAVRRFLPVLPQERQGRGLDDVPMKSRLGLGNLMIYGLIGLLFCVLCINIFSTDKAQIQQRPVLLISVLIIVALVVTRQIATILENYRLVNRQAAVLQQLEQANQRLEEQGRMIAQRNIDLEQGITHLKEVQAQLANGNTRARAQIRSGELTSLAGSFNLMADRLVRTEGVDDYLQRLTKVLRDLSMGLEQQRMGNPFRLPPSYREFPEIRRLLLAMGMSETPSRPLTGWGQRLKKPQEVNQER